MTAMSCMGGWCRMRDRCGLYAPGSHDADPAERLCRPGKDDPERARASTTDNQCTRCGKAGHRASQCTQPVAQREGAAA